MTTTQVGKSVYRRNVGIRLQWLLRMCCKQDVYARVKTSKRLSVPADATTYCVWERRAE